MAAYLQLNEKDPEFRYELIVTPFERGMGQHADRALGSTHPDPESPARRISRRLILAELFVTVVVLFLVGPIVPAQAHVPNACHSGGLFGNYPPSPCTTPVAPPPVEASTPVTGSDVGVPLLSAGFLIVLGGALLWVRVLYRKKDA
jgi:hypothetical protein